MIVPYQQSLFDNNWRAIGSVIFAVICILTVLCLIAIRASTLSNNGGNPIPLAGEASGKRRFSLRTRLAYYFDCNSLFQDAYDRFSKGGQPVWIPTMGARSEVVLPISYLSWAMSQPESVLSPEQAYVELNAIKSVLGDNRHMTDTWPGHLVKTDLNKSLDIILPAIKDELEHAIDSRFGRDSSNWVELPLDTIRMVVAQAASRYTVGLELCRDEAYLQDVLYITDGMPRNAIVVGTAPNFLKPLFGFIGSLDIRHRLSKLINKFTPLFQCRFELLKNDKGDFHEPEDFFQMMMRFAQKKRPDELELYTMATRLCMANFSSIHQTSFAASNVLLDLISSDAEFDTISSLRAEATAVLGLEQNNRDTKSQWTKPNIQMLHKADSVCRESLRLHTFPQRFAPRRVMAPNLSTPHGHHLPKGTIITFFSGPVHRDADNYLEPLKYDPWRFSRKHGPELVSLASSDFFSFGRGRHACSGRELVDYELKMMVSYLVRNYDLKLPERYGGRRPANTWGAEVQFPPNGVGIMVKRRG